MNVPSHPAGRVECEPDSPLIATSGLYYLQNKKRPLSNFVRAEVTGAQYFLYVAENLPDDRLGCPGRWLFEMAWAHFAALGRQILGIRGSWTYGTNLRRVNELTAQDSMTVDDAAAKTWAFDRASSKGYTRVHLLDKTGSPGNFTTVDVVFLPEEPRDNAGNPT